jgi:hypothetical protein
VVEVVRARYGNNREALLKTENYADVLQGLTELSGEVIDERTGQTYEVSGADFWKSVPRVWPRVCRAMLVAAAWALWSRPNCHAPPTS